jgi:murein DD-endopeptidase MepM/ murein hydrolase activator NlpD
MIYKLRLRGLFSGFMLLSLFPSLYACAPGNEGGISEEQRLGVEQKKRDSYVLKFSKAAEISYVGASPVAPVASTSCRASEGSQLKVGAFSQLNASMTALKGILDFNSPSSGILSLTQTTMKGGSSVSSDLQALGKMEPCSKELLLQLIDRSRERLLQVVTNSYLIEEEDPNSPSELEVPSDLPGAKGTEGKVCGLKFPMQKGLWTTLPRGRFGERRGYGRHSGHDFAPFGMKYISIFAVAAGVTFDPGLNEAYGNRIKIRHPDCDQRFAFVTHYAHNSANKVTANYMRVLEGQLIAKAGQSGTAAVGVHLHFDLINVANGTKNYVNPLTYMTKGYPE